MNSEDKTYLIKTKNKNNTKICFPSLPPLALASNAYAREHRLTNLCELH